MRLSPPASPLALTLATLLLPAALAAQAAAPAASRPPGCRGTTSQSSSFTLARENGPPVVFPSYGAVETVQPGSPAEAAGMRPGDVVVLQDGRDLIGNPPAQPALAGDTVVFVVRRNGAEVPLTVVLGQWDPPQEAEGVTRVCRPMGSQTASAKPD
ncbi:PDZ domain-containing protein [Longimicrobium sp.]|uniref:PDZ domain-containing protein n=1 Tax=Longimicrobium sp. TaxID=2029185 RepID=UPI002D1A3FBA|nr:PDZ domain-containing protein [Longimicrobium sp.]HSU14101.1 PDZ domain-containing protein [Longimicrobium sp.]